jgi:hypothetical protein
MDIEERNKQPEFDPTKILVEDGVVLAITTFLFAFSLYLCFKIFSLVRFSDLSLLLSIILISLALLCIIAWTTFDILMLVLPRDKTPSQF